MRIDVAHPAEYVAALELLFQHRPPDEALARTRAILDSLAVDTNGSIFLLVARDDRTLAGAMLAEIVPGATGVVWPPRARESRIEDALAQEAWTRLRRLGANVAQSVLPAREAASAAPLLRAGFVRVTELVTLIAAPRPVEAAGDFTTYARCPIDEFHDTLARSFDGGRDFPELDGRRSLQDMLDGYQAAGYDPHRWWLLREAGRPVGVVLLTEVEPGRIWDLAYVGVMPEFRRRGHGRTLVAKAIAAAHGAGVSELTLSVDARNQPALALYRAAAFAERERGDVYLRVE